MRFLSVIRHTRAQVKEAMKQGKATSNGQILNLDKRKSSSSQSSRQSNSSFQEQFIDSELKLSESPEVLIWRRGVVENKLPIPFESENTFDLTCAGGFVYESVSSPTDVSTNSPIDESEKGLLWNQPRPATKIEVHPLPTGSNQQKHETKVQDTSKVANFTMYEPHRA